MAMRDCKIGKCKDKNGNCPTLGSDNLPVQCVGPWVEDKYFVLERYLNASCEARRKFADKGNTVFIDLFAGPGKGIVKGEKREINSGGIRAITREQAPFNESFHFDISEINVDALKKRSDKIPNCHAIQGNSNVLVDRLVKELAKNSYRYHFAFVDPFGPEGLKFATLEKLAKFKRMDMLIHFPIGAIKRNLGKWLKKKESTILDEFLDTTSWRDELKNVTDDKTYQVLIDIFKRQLISIGYPEEGLNLASSNNIYIGLPTVCIRNTKEVDLYVLILASKHKLGQKIWNSIIKVNPDGQKELF